MVDSGEVCLFVHRSVIVSLDLRMAMIRCCKRRKVEGGDDRITDLPINVKHQIQELLSIEEAARMSVLSKQWRHVWASIPNLQFSDQFCHDKPPDKLLDIINTILSQHVGAVKRFYLNMSSIPEEKFPIVDLWMLFLSRYGIKHLTLRNKKNTRYEWPSYMYGCVELEYLDLSRCIFRPPWNFRGFPKLKTLKLLRVSFQLDIGTSVLLMPNLEFLVLLACEALYQLKMSAPKLAELHLVIIGTGTLSLDHFMDCRELKQVSIQSNREGDKVTNLKNLFSRCPKLSQLSLDSYYFKCFESDAEEERLPTCLESLTSIIYFDDEDKIICLLRKLRSTPNLKDLLVKSRLKMKDGVEDDVNHFEGPAYSTKELNKLQKFEFTQGLNKLQKFEFTQGLNKLQKFEFQSFRRLRAELLFIRFILASAPLLLKIILLVHEGFHESYYLKISEELMGFPRASPKLEIICRSADLAKPKFV